MSQLLLAGPTSSPFGYSLCSSCTAGATVYRYDDYIRAIYGPNIEPADILAGQVPPPAQVQSPCPDSTLIDLAPRA